MTDKTATVVKPLCNGKGSAPSSLVPDPEKGTVFGAEPESADATETVNQSTTMTTVLEEQFRLITEFRPSAYQV